MSEPMYDEAAYVHVASIEERTLDALLRIEGLLAKLVESGEPVKIAGELPDFITNIEPTETPFLESIKEEKAVDSNAKKKPSAKHERL
ncbi:hypothetical protein [Bradyrhizobium sp. BR 10289]|uniref:hypothetical protein n=1 Tax=Bradyrhizobium sp. BR 10289 TaxID=2749993 RepID=UPI001C64883F|nr:hypothetical protein [Bradyrhizobium sp. BR 10289]MBW7970969.1 hypothetical protein [Bradyrhizobium sp. BR 10289]